MAAPAWLIARPIAHRGLHDRAAGRIENSLEAAAAAVEGRYAVECDVTLSADGEAMVFHDDILDRLTAESGPVSARRASDLETVTLRGSSSRIPTLADLLALIGGRVPLVCEIKSHFDGSWRLAERAASLAASYAGPLAFKSFDPQVVKALGELAPDRPRGIVAETRYDHPEWDAVPPATLASLRNAAFLEELRVDFLSWHVNDLDTPAPRLARSRLGLPVMAWTVRTAADRAIAASFADQVVFEGIMA